MIEHALVAALRAALPDVRVFPGLVPEGAPLPWIVYREVDGGDSEEGFYAIAESPTFEIDVATEKGLTGSAYEATKIMAAQIRAGLRNGFKTGDVCVYDVGIGKQQDMIDDVDGLHWVRASYTLKYDKPLG